MSTTNSLKPRSYAPKPAAYNPDAARLSGHGIYTLDDIQARCRLDDLTGCWHWGMAISDGGKPNSSRTPRVSLPLGVVADVARTMSVARAVWLMLGRPLGVGQVVWRTCMHDDCCAPKHLKAGTKAQEGAWMTANGHRRGNPARQAINLRNVAQRQALPLPVVRTIEAAIAAGTLQRDIAASTGVNKATISKIAQGKHLHQRRAVPVASVFAWGAAQ